MLELSCNSFKKIDVIKLLFNLPHMIRLALLANELALSSSVCKYIKRQYLQVKFEKLF